MKQMSTQNGSNKQQEKKVFFEAPTISLTVSEPRFLKSAERLSQQYGWPLNKASTSFQISYNGDGYLELSASQFPKQKVSVDFLSGEFLHRIKTSGKNQTLLRSVGVDKGVKTVWDLTAGLGGDAAIMASCGLSVTGFERHPVVFCLLRDGWERFLTQHKNTAQTSSSELEKKILSLAKNLELNNQEALTALSGVSEVWPDVIYFDPMYPVTIKSALPRKEMQLLEALVGPDNDQNEIFELALKRAKQRVVVKRPSSAPPLHEPVTHSFEGATTRYDMYLLKST